MPNTESRYEPDVIYQTEDMRKGVKFEEFLTELRSKITDDEDSRSGWIDKIVIAENQRLGINRITNTPYEGAPDLPLPETDKCIKKAVANLVLSAWSPKKLATANVPLGVQLDVKTDQQLVVAEMAFNDLLRSPKIDLFNKLNLAADHTKCKGHALFKICNEFSKEKVHKTVDLLKLDPSMVENIKSLSRDEKVQLASQQFNLIPDDADDKETIDDIIDQFDSGEPILEFDKVEITSIPQIEVVNPNKVIVPKDTTDIASAERITYEVFMPQRQLVKDMKDGIFYDKNLEEILYKQGSENDDDIVEQQKVVNEGLDDTAKTGLWKLHYVNCWFSPTGVEGDEQRWVFVFLADVSSPTDALLFSKPFSYPYFNGWDFEKVDNEIKDARYYSSRGIPEQIRALQEFLERSFNNMLIRDEYNNMPIFAVKNGSDFAEDELTVAPGDKLVVDDINEIALLNKTSSPDYSSERILQYIKATMEEYQAVPDQLFNNSTNKGGANTKYEVQAGLSVIQGVANIDVINFNNVLSKVYTKMWQILKESGNPLFQFQFDVEVKSNGTLEIANQDIATQKALNRIAQVGLFRQAGLATAEDHYNAAKDWLEKDGNKNPEDYITNPVEIAKQEITQLEQYAMQLKQQIAQMQEIIERDQKNLARTQAKTEKVMNQFSGRMEIAKESVSKDLDEEKIKHATSPETKERIKKELERRKSNGNS